ncbi:unnamed protein product [Rotaria sp. Silwood1]|nr:unnamed protein product [Rotaria sp. Silwood1]CAF3594111.1 unnamed protein product [Rotaria sp. Silwood1]CAF4685040.1 unnamed protein product [Rotaria sp. Silwood1]CAF4737176.1 unnamed protein product [Rotaria sp. Silwood1]
MPAMSLLDLPSEIIFLIFEYLHKQHIVYSFLELNDDFALTVKCFIRKQFDLTKVNDDIIFQYCLSTVLPLIGSNLRYLSIGYPYCLSTYIKSIETYCPNLDTLTIYCCSQKEDIRHYVAHLIHHELTSLHFIFNHRIIGQQISLRLLDKSRNKEFQKNSIASSSLILHLSSMNDLILLKRYSESDYLPNGLYMIECMLNGEWLTYNKDDLCIMSKKFHYECIFSIKQIDNDQCCLEYELYHEHTQHRLTVLKYDEDEEYWISSSILSTHRKESFCLCSTFTFEKINNENQFYIRPCYSNAKHLQVLGKRIIVSVCNNDSILSHHFRFHHISYE